MNAPQWLHRLIAAPFRKPWAWVQKKAVKPMPPLERTKEQIIQELQARKCTVLMFRKPEMMHKAINGNAILDELARADMESKIGLDPGVVKQITDTKRSNRG